MVNTREMSIQIRVLPWRLSNSTSLVDEEEANQMKIQQTFTKYKN